MAKLDAIVVLPSPGCVLVTSSARGGQSTAESRTEVRRLRNASTIEECITLSLSIRYQGANDSCRAPFPSPPSASVPINLTKRGGSSLGTQTTAIKPKGEKP